MRAAGIQPLDFWGNGAANIITPPVRLFERNGRFYFALDFGVDGVYFNQPKTGMMRLFNVQIRRDRRAIVALTRDIAIVPESQWTQRQRSRSVRVWPADLLKNPALEFSGIYEDGWISGQAYMILGHSDPGDKLVIRGTVPAIGRLRADGNRIRISINGSLISERQFKPGHFEIWHTFTESSRENRIEFSFAVSDALPSPDDRPVAAQLTQVSIVDGRGVTRAESK
jgi:hypothetical protein